MKKRFFLSLVVLAIIVSAWLIIRADNNNLAETDNRFSSIQHRQKSLKNHRYRAGEDSRTRHT